MREIVLDTETTGLDPSEGHRVVEIGCIELINQIPTGEAFHTYLNPERSMTHDAFAVHGLDGEFLAKQPLFADVADAFVDFVGRSALVIHNASFDLKFINSELRLADRAGLEVEKVIDTLEMARHKFPGAPASLDALCRRFGIDNSDRTKHGALLDAELLSCVYVELIGGRQPALGLRQEPELSGAEVADQIGARPPRPHAPTSQELKAHASFVALLENPIWKT
tara:strand:- start:78 stop:749 length:672 start_codon:yes stop_codon:yes gene_type:complete